MQPLPAQPGCRRGSGRSQWATGNADFSRRQPAPSLVAKISAGGPAAKGHLGEDESGRIAAVDCGTQ